MPTYAYECVLCGEFTEWRSIHDDTPLETHTCGNTVARIFTPPALYAIGGKGSETRRVDGKEAEWSRDMAEYRSLRRQGIQPQKIDGCSELAGSSKSTFEIESGLLGVPETKVQESYDFVREAGLL